MTFYVQQSNKTWMHAGLKVSLLQPAGIFTIYYYCKKLLLLSLNYNKVDLECNAAAFNARISH